MMDHHKISILMGVGAAGVLLYLLLHREPQVASGGSSIPDGAVAGPQSYPQNPTPIDTGSIDIGGSPVNLTYNYGEPLPTMSVGDNTGGACGCDAYCEPAGQKTTVQNVPPEVLRSAADNFAGYTSKIAPQRVSFSQVPSGAALVQPSSVKMG